VQSACGQNSPDLNRSGYMVMAACRRGRQHGERSGEMTEQDEQSRYERLVEYQSQIDRLQEELHDPKGTYKDHIRITEQLRVLYRRVAVEVGDLPPTSLIVMYDDDDDLDDDDDDSDK
jgi:hypothetical protein